ncbi:MAG TPA: dephospho-CoA kinase [Parachlamydiaceae bacterium]|nr:dephospho-CoA kinase [Parachlamydiaceae bacterium]
MLNLKKTLKKGAVTGGLSCGKSSVCRFFEELGAYVVSADEIVHKLLSSNQEIIQETVKLLGSDILINNQIDRLKIAKKVFDHPLLLNALETLLHPAVQKEIKDQYECKKNEGSASLFIAEIPLLFEINANFFFDFTIAVIADEKICKERFQKTGHTKEEFASRQKRQLGNVEKSEKADYTIVNNGSLKELKTAVIELYKKIK